MKMIQGREQQLGKEAEHHKFWNGSQKDGYREGSSLVHVGTSHVKGYSCQLEENSTEYKEDTHMDHQWKLSVLYRR